MTIEPTHGDPQSPDAMLRWVRPSQGTAPRDEREWHFATTFTPGGVAITACGADMQGEVVTTAHLPRYALFCHPCRSEALRVLDGIAA